MTSHVTISHGSDFFGVDTIAVTALRALSQHVRAVLPSDDHPPLTAILDDAGERPHILDTAQAALLAVLLHRAAAHRKLPRQCRDVATLLGIAAATAATDTTPWTWTPTTEGHPR
ncbi:hypothetical protein ABZ135_36880 [Streptomyces sp. NPDC006339]|uniref:DUF7739 domain-containing protein n=1 Tax=Streptomyces sp. NPDC006339 TaxID=3156755 RepID=UPI0033BB74BD